MLPTLSALAEPNRLRIVELLREGPRPVGEIAARLQLRQPQVSKHLRVLSEAGLVEVHPAAQQRIYRLRTEPFQALDAWLESYR
ncbi:MAG: ArsR/SmtB family transcription factor, partial [Anaerolineales bacterium]